MCSVDERVRLEFFFFHFESNFEPEELNLFSLMFFSVLLLSLRLGIFFLVSVFDLFRFLCVCVCACVSFILHRLGARSEFRQGYAAIKYIKINGYRVIRRTSHKRTNKSTKNHTQIHTILCRMMLGTLFEYTFRSERVRERGRERARLDCRSTSSVRSNLSVMLTRELRRVYCNLFIPYVHKMNRENM